MRTLSSKPDSTVSLCMIARDNEKTLAESLASAREWVDEIVVVDTGSTDRTREIALNHGARVEVFPWCDDFSAARNRSLDFATGDWVFWMDTDDTLPRKCGKLLRDLVAEPVSDDLLGFIMQVHCPADAPPGSQNVPTGAPSTETGMAGDDPEAPWWERAFRRATIVDHVKLVRNRPNIRFEGRIHEQVLPSIRRAGGQVAWSDAFVVHSGCDNSTAGRRRKLDRDLRLLYLDIAERPGHPFVLFNLGMTLLHSGDFAKATQALEDCVHRSSTDESHLRKAYALLVEGLERCGRTAEGRQRCWEGLGRYPDDGELAFKLGRSLMSSRQWGEAVKAFDRVNAPGAARHFSSVDPEIRGSKCFANRAVCQSELGNHQLAAEEWMACLRLSPESEDAWEGLLGALRAGNNLDFVKPLVEELSGQTGVQPFVTVCRAVTSVNNEQAGALFEEAVSQSGGSSRFVLDEQARHFCNHQCWEKAVPVLRQLIHLDRFSPSAHHNLGTALLRLGRFVEADNALHTALQLRPGYEATRKAMVESQTALKDSVAKAISDPANACDVLLTMCFVGNPDPQRGFDWPENGDLSVLMDHWRLGAARMRLRNAILFDGLSGRFVSQRYSGLSEFHHVELRKGFAPNDMRFTAVIDYLEQHPEILRLYFTDLFDVSIINNPFQLPELGCELVVASEPTCLGANPWMKAQWARVWKEDIPPELADKPVLNCGGFGGQRDAVLNLCRRAHRHLESLGSEGGPRDMAVFNQVLYREIGEDGFWAGGPPLHSRFKEYEYERTDVAFVHK